MFRHVKEAECKADNGTSRRGQRGNMYVMERWGRVGICRSLEATTILAFT